MITDLKRIVEAVLFAAETPLSLAQICQVLETKDKAPVQTALEELSREYDFLERAFELVEVAGGWRLRTRPDMAFWLRKLKRQSKTRLSRASLETLAIIAYKQPVLKAEIERIRGVEVSGVLRMLMEKELARVVGRKDLPGRPLIYGTTKRFLEVFGLKDLSDLPTLEEMQELLGDTDVVMEGEQEEAPLFTRGMAGQDGEEAVEGEADGSESEEAVELGEADDGPHEEALSELAQAIQPDESVIDETEPASAVAYDSVEPYKEEDLDQVEVELAPAQEEPELTIQAETLSIEPSKYRFDNKPKIQEETTQQPSSDLEQQDQKDDSTEQPVSHIPPQEDSGDSSDQGGSGGEPGPQAA